MSSPEPLVSVIVPTYNRAKLLSRTLDALHAQTFRSYEILVVDDGSTDDTPGVVSRYGGVRYFRQPNKGPAAARNLAIQNARGQWIAMTDDDTIPQPTWLEAFARALESNPDWVGAEGSTHCPDATPLGHWVENLRGGQYITANMAYRAEALTEVGGFDVRFPYPKCEDTELAWRCGRLGTIGFCPSAVVIHPDRPQSWIAMLRQARYDVSEFYLYRKLGPDYARFRRFSHPWMTILLVYAAVPLWKLWRFRGSWMREPATLPQFLLLSLARPFAFVGYWAIQGRGASRP